MKKALKIVSLVFVFFSILLTFLVYYLFFYTPKFEVEDFVEFHIEQFTKEKWDKAIDDPEKRGGMIYSFLKNNKVIGVRHLKIRELLGELTYYYYYDTFPAYRIDKDSKKYVLVFVSDHETGLISHLRLVELDENENIKNSYFF